MHHANIAPSPCRLILFFFKKKREFDPFFSSRSSHQTTGRGRHGAGPDATVRDGGERWPYENGKAGPHRKAGTKRRRALSCARENIDKPPTPRPSDSARDPAPTRECHVCRPRCGCETDAHGPPDTTRTGATNSIAKPHQAAAGGRWARATTTPHPRASPAHRPPGHPPSAPAGGREGQAGDRRTGRLGMFSPSAGHAPLILTTPLRRLSGGRHSPGPWPRFVRTLLRSSARHGQGKLLPVPALLRTPAERPRMPATAIMGSNSCCFQ